MIRCFSILSSYWKLPYQYHLHAARSLRAGNELLAEMLWRQFCSKTNSSSCGKVLLTNSTRLFCDSLRVLRLSRWRLLKLLILLKAEITITMYSNLTARWRSSLADEFAGYRCATIQASLTKEFHCSWTHWDWCIQSSVRWVLEGSFAQRSPRWIVRYADWSDYQVYCTRRLLSVGWLHYQWPYECQERQALVLCCCLTKYCQSWGL